jgi:phenylalanine-4-hydroxylase
VIDDFAQLFDATGPDFTPIYAKLRHSPAHAAGDVLDGDRVFTRGDRAGWANNADT